MGHRRSDKGGPFERLMCRTFSLWLSVGLRDDWLWRSSGSGGRATRRAATGRATAGHCGDTFATCPQAELFMRLVTLELKSGYNTRAFLADMLDRKVWPLETKQKKATMLGFFEQAAAAARNAGTPYWAVVHKRDSRVPVLYAPRDFVSGLTPDGSVVKPKVILWYSLLRNPVCVVGMRLEDFLEVADPRRVRRYFKNGGAWT